MNDVLFQRLAHELLQKHYGIDVGDTSISSERIAAALVKQGVRPFDAVNQHAQACNLDRVDREERFGVPSKDPLTMQDELAILALVRPVFLLGDQPTCCPFSLTELAERVESINRRHCWLGHLPPRLYEERHSAYAEVMSFAKKTLSPADYRLFYGAF